jgi:lipoprotein-releasing system permease protein
VYQALLTRRYLTSKIMPLLASLAVMLCTTMVLVTWSVMGGFLKVLLDSGRKLVGDVKIEWPNSGFAYYDELIKDLEADSGLSANGLSGSGLSGNGKTSPRSTAASPPKGLIVAAAPIIESFGVLGLPDGRTVNVMLKGVEPVSFDRVTNYYGTLWWKPLENPLPKDDRAEDPRLRNLTRVDKLVPGAIPTDKTDVWPIMFENGKQLHRFQTSTGQIKPAVVLGTEVTGYNKRFASGYYEPMMSRVRNSDGNVDLVSTFMPLEGEVTLHVLPLDKKGRGVEMQSRIFPVANEFKTDVYLFDKGVAILPLHELQKMLKMDAAKRLEAGTPAVRIVKDPQTGEEKIETVAQDQLKDDPARVTGVLVRGKDGINARILRDRCEEIYAEFAARHPGVVPPAASMSIQTWQQQNAGFIGAVEKEIALVLFLFSMISLVAVVLVLSIFWSMVSEKTKDIGILRAIGASKAGIAWLWLRYGLAIGVVGSIMGFGLSSLIILNINPIHEWMGRAIGIQIWDPSIYYFTQIPSDLRWDKVLIVLAGGVGFSVLGALIPALRASRMDPVRALRFE